MKNKIIKWLGGYTAQEYSTVAYLPVRECFVSEKYDLVPLCDETYISQQDMPNQYAFQRVMKFEVNQAVERLMDIILKKEMITVETAAEPWKDPFATKVRVSVMVAVPKEKALG